ncbi:MAG TPA: IreB family regulatory phosphoprotein [Candidatus Faecimorpha stercoravium]|nr:IreB family regulatory phosphoprotein [Candidatus Faecimorpha stercoravium]
MDRNTKYFNVVSDDSNPVRSALVDVYRALQKKGYNPVNQIVGYIMSDDPTYITSYQNARSRIARLTRDEILEELVKTFIEANHLDDQEESRS